MGNYVIDGAKIECMMCSNPMGTLMVTSNQIKLQDKFWATEADKGIPNLQFSGPCMASPYQALPCLSCISVGNWMGTADALIQDNKALLDTSTIMCSYGGSMIKISQHMQMNVPTTLLPTQAPVVAPVEEPEIVKLEWKSNEEDSGTDVEGETIDKTFEEDKVWLIATTMNILPGQEIEIDIQDKFEPRGKQTAAVDASTATVNQPSSSPPDLKKFHIHFRRTDDYEGTYGFDWLRDEYIYPIVNVTHDNSGDPTLNAATALCLNVAQIKREYKTTGVLNPVSPYGEDYYPAWLSIFPYTTTAQFPHGSTMHASGVDLKLEIEELESLVSDATKITFEPSSDHIVISPSEIDLQSLVGNSNSKTYGNGNTGVIANQKVNVKCVGAPLTRHEEIKVFAELGARREEVGKLMLYKNNIIPKAELVVVNVITDRTVPSISPDFQYALKYQAFNQALIRADVIVDTTFNLYQLSINWSHVYNDVRDFYIYLNSNNPSSRQIAEKIVELYENHGRHKPPRGWFGLGRGAINPVIGGTKRTYVFYTNIDSDDLGGICSMDAIFNWGNSFVVFKNALQSNFTFIHEAGHSFGLPHVFQMGDMAGPHKFYHGYTDNVMDYRNQKGAPGSTGTGNNAYKGKMYSLCKWQWEIIRNDRSLITNY